MAASRSTEGEISGRPSTTMLVKFKLSEGGDACPAFTCQTYVRCVIFVSFVFTICREIYIVVHVCVSQVHQWQQHHHVTSWPFHRFGVPSKFVSGPYDVCSHVRRMFCIRSGSGHWWVNCLLLVRYCLLVSPFGSFTWNLAIHIFPYRRLVSSYLSHGCTSLCGCDCVYETGGCWRTASKKSSIMPSWVWRLFKVCEWGMGSGRDVPFDLWQ